MLSHLSLMYFLKSRPMIFEYLFDADSSNGFYDVVVLENIHIIKIVALISLRKNPRHQRRRGLFYKQKGRGSNPDQRLGGGLC